MYTEVSLICKARPSKKLCSEIVLNTIYIFSQDVCISRCVLQVVWTLNERRCQDMPKPQLGIIIYITFQ